jgi:hypothetical protein
MKKRWHSANFPVPGSSVNFCFDTARPHREADFRSLKKDEADKIQYPFPKQVEGIA